MPRADNPSSWWDNDADPAGRPIRKDVRDAAHQIWVEACSLSERIMGDSTQVPEVLETSVAQISRYLDRNKVPQDSADIKGLLMLTVRRALVRSAAKLRRLELRGGLPELSIHLVDKEWGRKTEIRVDLQRIIAHLSQRNREILALWVAGYQWEEIATIMGSSAGALRNAFWRDVRRAKVKMEDEKPEHDGTNYN